MDALGENVVAAYPRPASSKGVALSNLEQKPGISSRCPEVLDAR